MRRFAEDSLSEDGKDVLKALTKAYPEMDREDLIKKLKSIECLTIGGRRWSVSSDYHYGGVE